MLLLKWGFSRKPHSSSAEHTKVKSHDQAYMWDYLCLLNEGHISQGVSLCWLFRMQILCKRQLDFEVFFSGVKKALVFSSSLWSLKEELMPESLNSLYHYPVICVCFIPRLSASWIGLCGSTSSLLGLSGLAYFSTPLQYWLLNCLALFSRCRFKWLLLCVLLS